MKKSFLILFFLLQATINIEASNPFKDTCKAGVYLKALYDFNSSEFSYDVDLWMWFYIKMIV